MDVKFTTNANIIKALEVFVAVVETGQMTAAARLAGMTQSAASQHIGTLEKHYDVKLLDRSTRPVKPTQAGVMMYRHAGRILQAVGELASDMRHQGPTPISRLRLGLQASIATTLSPGLVRMAKDRFGVQDMVLHAGQSGDHEALLRTKQADIAITSDPLLDMDGLERHAVLTEAFLLVLPPGFNQPVQDLEQVLRHLPLVRFADTTNVGRRIGQHLRRLRLQPERVIQADRSSMVTACVADGMGFTLLTPTLLIDGLVERMPLDLRPLPGAGMSRSITVVARDGELGELPKAFAEYARVSLVDQITGQMGKIGTAALAGLETEEEPL
ncbi:LysR family transcriptional regulator [Tropicibacter sp. R16_0]|uniref:LysR family transcriptional regulator n=1 Tax=Tropicibacter sp. R16_0 TaxID=2821102 RepID=UPI001ADB2E30|nr:LysR family transcriptional regulator [Tropicibacter sp. R16_0]MBO9452844.1 LysR family transcriptional regulator [Tropicibacter sp. R16_0]